MTLPSPANLFASLAFGVVGAGAFMYGKKTGGIRAMVLGVGLMVYPYFVDPTWLLYTIGIALTAALFVFRD
ncbi:MAG TPA: hypothetical protein VEG27_04340 [Usitatibacter sp.]|nr:hypothetical protein [Usitatibacter sp.]